MIPRVYIAAACLLLPVLAGCPSLWQSKSAVSEGRPEELFATAQKEFDNKRYAEAADLFQRLRSAHPDFEKMPDVYLRIGDAFFNQGKYEEAVSRYRQFTELYPNHKDRHQAKYMIGMAFFQQIKGTDLDNTMVKKAEDTFKQIVDDEEAGEWATKAEEKYRACRKQLAEKELYKARTYLSLSNYKAARMAAQRVIDDYSGLGLDKEAKKLLDGVKGR